MSLVSYDTWNKAVEFLVIVRENIGAGLKELPLTKTGTISTSQRIMTVVDCEILNTV